MKATLDSIFAEQKPKLTLIERALNKKTKKEVKPDLKSMKQAMQKRKKSNEEEIVVMAPPAKE